MNLTGAPPVLFWRAGGATSARRLDLPRDENFAGAE
jgi:hypothetical protein